VGTITIETVGATERKGLTRGNGEDGVAGGKVLTEGKEGNEAKEGNGVLEMLGRVKEILNRGGRAEEKVLEAREVLASGGTAT
jgi:hypothetical protein